MLEVGIPMFLFPFFIKVVCKVTLSTPCLWASFHHPILPFSGISKSKDTLLNLSMKCRNSGLNLSIKTTWHWFCTRGYGGFGQFSPLVQGKVRREQGAPVGQTLPSLPGGNSC
jgi:hypothetical protein